MKCSKMPPKKSLTSSPSLPIFSRLRHFLKLKMQSMVKCLRIFLDGSTDSKLPDDSFCVLERRLWTMALIASALVILSAFWGCSPTNKIAKASTTISTNATSSKDRFSLIKEESGASTPDLAVIKSEAVGGIKEQETIIAYTQDIQHLLPSVEDQMPEWLRVVEYGIIVGGILGVCWLLWYTGIGTLIKGLVGFIPRAKRREASLASEVLDENSPATVRELVAAKRASDPEFDKAYERTRTKRPRTIRPDEGPTAGV